MSKLLSLICSQVIQYTQNLKNIKICARITSLTWDLLVWSKFIEICLAI